MGSKIFQWYGFTSNDEFYFTMRLCWEQCTSERKREGTFESSSHALSPESWESSSWNIQSKRSLFVTSLCRQCKNSPPKTSTHYQGKRKQKLVFIRTKNSKGWESRKSRLFQELAGDTVESAAQCSGWNEKVSLRLVYLNTWSQSVELWGKDQEGGLASGGITGCRLLGFKSPSPSLLVPSSPGCGSRCKLSVTAPPPCLLVTLKLWAPN